MVGLALAFANVVGHRGRLARLGTLLTIPLFLVLLIVSTLIVLTALDVLGYERPARLPEIVGASDPIIHHTFDAGEGVLIPAEIIHNAEKGVRNFVILQPFGCLPNHVVGRGITKRLKELYPDAQVLPLDFDPDVSFANIENRLQMLVMDMRADAEPVPGAVREGVDVGDLVAEWGSRIADTAQSALDGAAGSGRACEGSR